MDGLDYPTGVEVHAGSEPIEASVSLAAGSPSVPGIDTAAGGVQVSGRVAYRPVPGLRLGASASHGPFLSQSIVDLLESRGIGAANGQTAAGADVEYSFGYWVLRSEAIYSRWKIPAIAAPLVSDPLRAFAVYLEGRYRIRPGLYAAARVDRLDFSDITGNAGTMPWDAPVRRVEAGGGYSLSRNLLLKMVYQYNWRRGVIERRAGLASAQLLFWF
jgi:predicted porin